MYYELRDQGCKHQNEVLSDLPIVYLGINAGLSINRASHLIRASVLF